MTLEQDVAKVITLSGLIIAFLLFVTLALKARSRRHLIGSLTFQVSMFVITWLVGEVIPLILGEALGLTAGVIHTISMALFLFFIVLRARRLSGGGDHGAA